MALNDQQGLHLHVEPPIVRMHTTSSGEGVDNGDNE